MKKGEFTAKRKIEELRLSMYQAYQKDPVGEQVIKISQELDQIILTVQKQQLTP